LRAERISSGNGRTYTATYSLVAASGGTLAATVPSPGEVFIYLVEYVDGVGVSYGAESADKPRIAAGGCP
jgi:hypothetical protein